MSKTLDRLIVEKEYSDPVLYDALKAISREHAIEIDRRGDVIQQLRKELANTTTPMFYPTGNPSKADLKRWWEHWNAETERLVNGD